MRKHARMGGAITPIAEHLENQLLREDRSALETVEPIRRQVERGLESEDLLGDRASDGRALHETVTGEPASRINTLADAAKNRVRVRRHVVETRPRTVDSRARGCRKAMDEPLEAGARKALVHEP